MAREQAVVVREGRAEDVAAVLALWATARERPASVPDSAAAVERLLADRPGALLVAERDGAVVGALIAASDGWRGNLYRLAVHHGHRRRGVALALVREGERRLCAAGTPRITALVAAEDVDAVGFWAAAGYAHERGTGRFVRDG